MEAIRNLWQDESAASVVEYSLLLGFIALAIITGLNTLGQTLSNMFNSMSSAITTAS
jgi:pilus assembly protein Flp/PilA